MDPVEESRRQQCREAVEARRVHGSTNAAAKALGVAESTLRGRIRKHKEYEGEPSPPAFELPDFPEDDLPVEDIIDLQCRRFEKRHASHKAHDWFPITFKEDRPIGVLMMGDPHVDDNGCNWPLLKHHAQVCRETDGLYAINIGDTTNCWGGRLIRKYADQDTSAKTARRLAEWLLIGSKIKWLVWLYGNHEHMGDGAYILAEMAKRYDTKKIVMHDWEARFTLDFPNGVSVRVNCAHDLPGNSMWNPLHGPVKAAMFGDRLDLLVCGHKHNWAVSQWELAEQGTAPLMIRVRGYKHDDDYARKIGKYDQAHGQSIMVVVDPAAATESARLKPFIDIDEGAEYLTWLRSRDA